jgi:GntP family gluconate:H+ symporter
MPNAPDTAFALAIALLTVLVATSWLRLHPFLVLIATAYAVAFASGLSLAQVSGAVEDGFGGVMSSIGIVIFASGIIGASLERSGAALVLADATMRVVGEKRPALAFNVTGYFISIPVFCDAGFALLAPLTRAIASRTATSITVLAVALATGLYATHSLVPPTPGPLAAALTLKANVGLTAGLGLLVAIPVALVGLAWAYIVDRLGHGTVSSLKPDYVRWDDLIASKGPLPSLGAALAPILLPLGLIAIGTLAGWSADAGATALSRFLIFLGNPSTALLLGALASLALKREQGNALESDWIMEGLKNSGAVLAVTGAGGALSHALAMTAAGQPTRIHERDGPRAARAGHRVRRHGRLPRQRQLLLGRRAGIWHPCFQCLPIADAGHTGPGYGRSADRVGPFNLPALTSGGLVAGPPRRLR